MAFTQITSAGFGLTTGTLVGVAASFSSTVSVGGTLTYEDVTNVDSVGLITARNGIEVTDKGVQVGTGATVDSAADNTLTFLTNGDERIRVTSAGKLLVGITSSSGSHILEVNSGTDNEGIKVVSTDAGSYTRFADNSTTGSTRLGAVGDEFKIDVASAERLRITSDGDVLIGATSGNSEKLRVQDNATTGTSCQLSIISGNAERGILNFGDAEDHNIGRISYHHSDNALFFHTNNTERLRIDSSGRVGINNSSPSQALHVTTSGAGQIRIADGNRAAALGSTGSICFVGSVTSGQAFAFYSANSERMRINADGQLLINTTSPANSDTNIEVHDTSVPEFAFGRNDTSIVAGNGLGRLRFYGNDSNGTFQECARISAEADGTHQTDDKATRLSFWTTEGGNSSPTERLRIHQQGHGEFYKGAVTRVVVGGDVTLSGGSTTVTGIPSWATKITIILYRASLSGNADFLVILRANGSDITSNYNSVSVNHTGATVDTSTAGFIITNTNSSHKTSGRMVIEKIGPDTKWVATHMMTQDSGPAPRMGAGDLSNYSGTIDGIKIKDTGSNTFDNGTITVIAEA